MASSRYSWNKVFYNGAASRNTSQVVKLKCIYFKVFQMTLLRKLEQIAEEKGTFHTYTQIQFGFSEGVGCLEASYVISECINQLLEKGVRYLHVFAMFVWHLTLSGYMVDYIS